MDRVHFMKEGLLAVMAAVGGVLTNQFGGWDVALQVLVFVMAADYVTGLIVAGVFKASPKSSGGALESRAGFIGLVRKGAILLLVLVSVQLDRYTGANYIRSMVCLFFTANEGLSILENIGLMGVPLPKFLKKMLEAMRSKADGGGEEQ